MKFLKEGLYLGRKPEGEDEEDDQPTEPSSSRY